MGRKCNSTMLDIYKQELEGKEKLLNELVLSTFHLSEDGEITVIYKEDYDYREKWSVELITTVNIILKADEEKRTVKI